MKNIFLAASLLLASFAAYAQCPTTISNFPHNEGFESTTPSWTPTTTVTTSCLEWIRTSGGTTSSGTGPSGAQSGSFYAYVEASTCTTSQIRTLTSPCYNLAGKASASFTFYYNMYGVNMGTLNLKVSNDNGATWTTLWTLSGDQGTAWHPVTVNLNLFLNQTIQLRMEGIIGVSYRSDMAIDNLTMDASGGTSLPDLTISSASAPTSVVAGSAAALSCIVNNALGTSSANSSSVAFYLSTNNTYSGDDVLLGTAAVGTLAAGASAQASFNASTPASTSGGTYFILYRADSNNDVLESNEANNVFARQITVVTATCSDGVQNGLETGVDCGGTCPPCGTTWVTNGIHINNLNTGNVGIGITTPTEKLTVNGMVLAKEFKATLNYPWPDYVFTPTHALLPLGELERYILTNGHLPNIPPADEVASNGVQLMEMNVKLLEKIEELTLYIIAMEKRIQTLEEDQKPEEK